MSDGDSARGTTFTETMLGTPGSTARTGPGRSGSTCGWRHRTCCARWGRPRPGSSGRLRIAGWADDPYVTGEMEISPFARRRIRYRLACTAQGRRLTLDGWKSVSPRHPVRSMTVLPFTLHDGGQRVGTGTLRFPLATGLAPFLGSFRFPRREDGSRHLAPALARESPAAPRSGTRPSPTRRPARPVAAPRADRAHRRIGRPSRTAGPRVFPRAEPDGPQGAVRHVRFGPEPWHGAPGRLPCGRHRRPCRASRRRGR